MDFSGAPIVTSEADDSSNLDDQESQYITSDTSYGILKRSISDPYNISNDINIRASLENLICTFDENLLTDSDESLDKKTKMDIIDKPTLKNNVENIKSFWRISVAPIDNPKLSYPLTNQLNFLNTEDFQMADADSISEEDSNVWYPQFNNALTNQNDLSDKSDEDTVATNSINPYSTSSETSSHSISLELEDCIDLKVCVLEPNGNFVVPDNKTKLNWHSQLSILKEDREVNALDTSINNAKHQAELEAFKARHPTLPTKKTSSWQSELHSLSPNLLNRYLEELLLETGNISDKLIAALAEREDLLLFREVEDDFIILLNAVQIRRRRAAETVLAAASQTYKVDRNMFNKQPFSSMISKPTNGFKGGSLVELCDLPSNNIPLKDATKFINSNTDSIESVNSRQGSHSRCPKGQPIRDSIQLPSLRSTITKITNKLSRQPSVSSSQVSIASEALVQLAEDEKKLPRLVQNQMLDLIRTSKSRGRRKHVGSLPSPYLPWPLGRPENSQTIKLRIPIPSENIDSWVLPRLRILNLILQATLYESVSVQDLIQELTDFDSNASNQKSQLITDDGFEMVTLPTMNTFSTNTKIQKSVKFDWNGNIKEDIQT